MSSFRRPLTVKRQNIAGAYVNGVYELANGGEEEIEIKASVQPLNGQDMRLLEENRREVESYKLYSDTQLLTTTKGSAVNPDIVIIFGSNFEVVHIYPNQSNVINHYKYLVQKVVSNDTIPISEA